jgi:uncharacterized protein (DUF885 family)
MRWVPVLLLAIPTIVMTNGSNETTLETRRAQLSAALQQQWEYELRTHPEMATYIGDNRYNDRLSDHSAATYAQELEHAKQTLASIETISADGFPAQEQLNKLLMVRRLREHVEAYGFKDREMPVDQFGGIHLSYAALPSATPFRSVKDYEDYLSRLHQIPRVFDEIRENMQLGLHDNLVPPRYLLEKVVVQAQDIADKSAHDSPFTQPVFKFPAGIPEAEQQRLHDATLAAVKNEAAPAYASFAAFVRTQYAPHGRADYGIWALPQGDARYRFDVRQMTTTDLGPEEIHQMGLKQVAEIENQMLALARRQGFADLASFNAHIRQDRDLYGKSGQQILELYQHYTDQMYAKLPQLFGHLPKTKLEVIPMEAFRAPDSVPADYSPGAGDGSRPGRINVNEYDPQHRLLLNVEAIAYHEGIPGHHLQFSIAQQLPNLPPFRRFASYNAYSEGWAFYAERLGKEAGFYQDPYSEYGRLENEMWRSVRLVVDTGVHYKHWSRQQMVDFFRQHTAMDEPNIQTEVDRYIAWPGQALAYKLGQMKILELRERAQDALGDKFNLRAFHDAVLADGPLPLDVLESRVNAWIGSKH